VVAGPRSRDLLSRVAPRTDWSQAAFPWLSTRTVHIDHFAVTALAVSYSGELAWELHVPNERLYGCYRVLVEAGREFGLAHFGNLAAESMRVEKGFRHWKADLITEFNPMESGLGRFVKLDKDFLGKAPLERMLEKGLRRSFVTLRLDSRKAPAHGGDSVLHNGRVVGTVCSAAWGHRVGCNLAMAFVEPGHSSSGTQLAVEILGEQIAATVSDECQYDPTFGRLRA